VFPGHQRSIATRTGLDPSVRPDGSRPTSSLRGASLHLHRFCPPPRQPRCSSAASPVCLPPIRCPCRVGSRVPGAGRKMKCLHQFVAHAERAAAFQSNGHLVSVPLGNRRPEAPRGACAMYCTVYCSSSLRSALDIACATEPATCCGASSRPLLDCFSDIQRDPDSTPARESPISRGLPFCLLRGVASGATVPKNLRHALPSPCKLLCCAYVDRFERRIESIRRSTAPNNMRAARCPKGTCAPVPKSRQPVWAPAFRQSSIPSPV